MRSFLRSSNGGGAWRVRVDKLDGSLFFRGGWESFAEAHSITDGDFIIFIFDGDRGFDVMVYGKTGYKKGASCSGEV